MTGAGRKLLILGLGRSGRAAAELGLVQGYDVTVLDEFTSDRLREEADHLANRGVRVELETTDTHLMRGTELAVISPGISPHSGLGRLAATLKCPLVSELEFGYSHCACPLIAVTGTNGKTTVTDLLTHCLRRAGYRAVSSGNIGTPLSETARKSAQYDYVVAEVSSFQLEHVCRFQPLAAAILNITPDHLNRHGTVAEYTSIKAHLLHNITDPRRVVLRSDLFAVSGISEDVSFDLNNSRTFSAAVEDNAEYHLSPDGWICCKRNGKQVPFLDTTRIRLPGKHNIENVAAVIALAEAAGIPGCSVAEHVPSFSPERHRLEIVANHDGILYINDSKATNPDALRQAILTATAGTPKTPSVVLIAGGLDKDVDFTELRSLLGKHVKGAFLIGTCRERLVNQWQGVVSCKMFASLASAFDAAREIARAGDTVLLSPGCASQDMFIDYAHRGEEFCRLVKRSVGE